MESTLKNPATRLAQIGGGLSFLLWAAMASVVSSFLLAGHLLTLPKPEQSATEAAIAALRTTDEQDRWLVVHVSYASCRCSQKVIEHLLASPRPAGVVERILWVGEASDRTAELERKGFRVTLVTADALATQYHIEGAPLLVVADAQGVARYQGGYTNRKQDGGIRDLEIIGAVTAGRGQAPLPLFGCAVSRPLQQKLTPFAWVVDAFRGGRPGQSK